MATISFIRPEKNYLHVGFEGHLAQLRDGLERTLKRHRNDIVRACRDHGCRHVLVDLTAVEGSVGLLEEHLTACAIIREWPPRSRVAMVPGPGCFPDGGEHLERVAGNRGAALRLFADTGDAVAWLEAVPMADGIRA